MICDTCKAENRTSHVVDRGGTATLPFWDEKGAYHRHGKTTTLYECSNGHRWTVNWTEPPCECGWPNKPEKDPPTDSELLGRALPLGWQPAPEAGDKITPDQPSGTPTLSINEATALANPEYAMSLGGTGISLNNGNSLREVFVVLTAADSGGSVFVAACSSREDAERLVAKNPGNFYYEQHALNVPCSSYDWILENKYDK